MTADRYRQIRALFDEVFELKLDEQPTRLLALCPDDPHLRAEVLDLLRRLSQLERSAETGTTRAAKSIQGVLPVTARLLDSSIGPYRITAVLGHGGMGAVYEAVHLKSGQSAALKLISPHVASPMVLRRFEFELQALARLEHPGIARIYHADMCDLGSGPQPYFAMELVRGPNLIEFAAQRKLTSRQRLELAARITDAVQYAHQQGVIHRDLKPGNILVTAEGQPKVLDFGVARATDADVQMTQVQTEIGQLIGTLSYMSPEQAAGDSRQVDTRSDVYSLGVLIYELLTGRRPYVLERRLLHEAVRIIREEEPTRMSSLNIALRGDVETIVGKALAKDKDRRYETANALGADIRRYLRNEPIAARPPNAAYQFRKFAARNKALVGGVATTFLALLVGFLGTAIALNRAQSAEAQTRRRAEELQRISDFQAEWLGQVDPAEAGRQLSVDVAGKLSEALQKYGAPASEREALLASFADMWRKLNATDLARAVLDRAILRPAVAALNEKFKDQPLVDAQLRHVLASRYEYWGLYDAALPLHEEALRLREIALGADHELTLDSVGRLGHLFQAMGKFSDAEIKFRSIIEAQRKRGRSEESDAIVACSNLAAALYEQGKWDEADALFENLVERQSRALGEEHPDVLSSQHNWGVMRQRKGDLAGAERDFRAVLEKQRRVLGIESAATLTSLGSLGSVLRLQGKLEEAEPYLREAFDLRRRVLGENHRDTLVSLNSIGLLLNSQRQPAAAEPYLRDAMVVSRRVLGERHPETLRSINNLAVALRAQGKMPEAEQFLRESLEGSRLIYGNDHAETITAINNLGLHLESMGRAEEGEPYIREALELGRRTIGELHPKTLNAFAALGYLQMSLGKLEAAEATLRESYALRRRAHGAEDVNTLISASNLASLLVMREQFGEAESIFRTIIEARIRVIGQEHPDTLGSIRSLASLLIRTGRHEEALSALEGALAVARQIGTGPQTGHLTTFLRVLGDAQVAGGCFCDAQATLLESAQYAMKLWGERDKRTRPCYESLIALYDAWHSAEPSQGYAAQAEKWRAKLDLSRPPATRPATPSASPANKAASR